MAIPLKRPPPDRTSIFPRPAATWSRRRSCRRRSRGWCRHRRSRAICRRRGKAQAISPRRRKWAIRLRGRRTCLKWRSASLPMPTSRPSPPPAPPSRCTWATRSTRRCTRGTWPRWRTSRESRPWRRCPAAASPSRRNFPCKHRRIRTPHDLGGGGTGDAVKFDHQGLTGKGVVVGIVDTGIDWRHQDFMNPDGTSRILYLWDIFDDTWEKSNHTVGSAPPSTPTTPANPWARSTPMPRSTPPSRDRSKSPGPTRWVMARPAPARPPATAWASRPKPIWSSSTLT